MTHFTVVVIGGDVERQLAPYDEGLQVEPYEEGCGCIGTIARLESRDSLRDRGLDLTNLRETWHRDLKPLLPPDEAVLQQKWEEHIKPYNDELAAAEAAHPLYQKPAPRCGDCKGSGKVMTQYNPNSKWDWYSIGGRWGDYFPLVDGTRNSETEAGQVDWPSYFEEHHHPTAVVAEGTWQEVGRVGWFGIIDETMKEEWAARVHQIFLSLPPSTPLTMLDCHI